MRTTTPRTRTRPALRTGSWALMLMGNLGIAARLRGRREPAFN